MMLRGRSEKLRIESVHDTTKGNIWMISEVKTEQKVSTSANSELNYAKTHLQN